MPGVEPGSELGRQHDSTMYRPSCSLDEKVEDGRNDFSPSSREF